MDRIALREVQPEEGRIAKDQSQSARRALALAFGILMNSNGRLARSEIRKLMYAGRRVCGGEASPVALNYWPCV